MRGVYHESGASRSPLWECRDRENGLCYMPEFDLWLLLLSKNVSRYMDSYDDEGWGVY